MYNRTPYTEVLHLVWDWRRRNYRGYDSLDKIPLDNWPDNIRAEAFAAVGIHVEQDMTTDGFKYFKVNPYSRTKTKRILDLT